MKKSIILLLICAAITTGAGAQTRDEKKDQKVLKNKIEDKKEDKHEAGKDLAHLRVKKALRKRREVRRHRKSIHRVAKDLREDGVKHPIKQAKTEAKLDKTKKDQR